jgi:hypothetical protein
MGKYYFAKIKVDQYGQIYILPYAKAKHYDDLNWYCKEHGYRLVNVVFDWFNWYAVLQSTKE